MKPNFAYFGITESEKDAIRLERKSGMTLAAVGLIHGITRERVRQICNSQPNEEKRAYELSVGLDPGRAYPRGPDLTRNRTFPDKPSAMSESPTPKSAAGVLPTLSAAEAANLDERGVPKHLGRLQRAVKLEGYDKETRTVTMAVSSETPVDRYFGQEILSHEKGAIDFSRIGEGVCPLLFNHNYDAHIGRVLSATITDGVLRVVASFAGNPLALEKEGDVASGDLVAVSIGYSVDEWEIVEQKDGSREYTGTRWQLYEVSLVTVPADPTVGVGRSSDPPPNVRSFRSMKAEDEAARASESDDEDDEEDEDDEDDTGTGSEDERSAAAPISPVPPIPTTQRTPTMADEIVDPAAKKAERTARLRTLQTAYPEHFTERQLHAAIDLDTPIERVQDAIFEGIARASERTAVPTIADDLFGSMSDGERKRYSIAAAYRAGVNLSKPGTFADDGGFEREVSQELRKLATERGIKDIGTGVLIPSATTRTLWKGGRPSERTIASGGNAGTASNFTTVDADPIELLRARTACLALGARMMTGLQGAVQMTRQNAAASSSWELEFGAVASSDPGFDFFTMRPNRLSMASSYTRDFLAQSQMAIESILAEDRMAVLARSLDTAAIAGSGTAPVPKGLLNYSGLSAVLAGTTRASNGTVTAGAGGVPLTYVDYNDMEATISTANADIGTLAWLTTPKVRAAGRSTPKIPGTASEFVWPDSKVGANGIQEGPLGYNALCTSNAVLTGFTANSVSGLHAAILGVWSQMLIGDWGLSEVIVDPYTGAADAVVNITEHGFYDVNFRHIQSFVACTSALPS